MRIRARRSPLKESPLVTTEGEVRLGLFREPITDINHRDYDLRTPFGRPVGGLRRHFAWKQFSFLGALSEELVFGCALADVGYAGSAFVYTFDPATGERNAASVLAPLARGFHFDTAPESGAVSFRRRGDAIEMNATPNPPRRRLRVKLRRGVEIDAEFREDEPLVSPMRICTRAGATGWVYARKTAGFAVEGSLRWGDRSWDLGAIRARGHSDWSAGFMRRRTFWNWGCLSGTTSDGRSLGLNVSCGVNETSFDENCFWLDGRLHKLGGVHFAYDRHDPLAPWRLVSSDHRLALEFEPEAAHVERRNAGIVATNFQQLTGRYRGELIASAGEAIAVDGMLGYAEVHYAKW